MHNSIKTKFFLCLAMIGVAVCMLVVGVLAFTEQTITMQGVVNIDVPDRSLYLRDVRVQQSGTTSTVENFRPSFINKNEGYDLGKLQIDTSQSFTLYLDFVNLKVDGYSSGYVIDPQLPTISGLTIEVVESSKYIDDATTSAENFNSSTPLSGTLQINVTNTSGTAIDLSQILLSFSEYYVEVTGFEFTFDETEKTAAVQKYTGTDTDVVIPAGISKKVVDGNTIFIEGNDYAVTSIADGASLYNSAFNSVRSTIQSVSLPQTLKRIGDYAFYNCTNLETLTFAEDSNLTEIGIWAFMYCSGLTGVITIPSTVTNIGASAFAFCNGLTGLIFEDGSEISSIGEEAFAECVSLADVLFSGSQLKVINTSAFSSCQNLVGELVIPASVETIGNSAFSFCRKLSGLTFADGSNLKTIEKRAFDHCEDMEGDLVIPDGVTSIGSSAFRNSGFSDSLIIPASVTTIAHDAFYPVFSQITVAPENPNYYSGDKNILFEKSTNTLILGFDTTSLSLTEYTIEHIAAEAFYGVALSGVLTIPATVKTIGDEAFCYQYNLTGLIIEAGSQLETIGESAFTGCDEMVATFPLPSTVTDIGNNAFVSTLVNGAVFSADSQIQNIGAGAFIDCKGLTSLYIPACTISIGSAAFGGCSGLETITVDENNQYYYSGGYNVIVEKSTQVLLAGCNNSIIPDGITGIGSRAFLNCKGLTGVLVIPDTTTTISSQAFSGCGNITSINIPASVGSIGSRAFQYCSRLTTVTKDSTAVGEGVTSKTAEG